MGRRIKKNAVTTILFEDINIFNAILSMSSIRKAKRVVLFRPYQIDKLEKIKFETKIAIWLVKTLNPLIEVLDIDKEILYPLAYINNYESETYVDDAARRFCKVPSWRLTRDIVGSDLVERMYKRYFLSLILPVSQFYRYAKRIMNSGQRVIIVPSNMDYFGMYRYFLDEKEFRSITTKGIRFFNKFTQELKKTVSILFLFNGLLLLRSVSYHLAKRIPCTFNLKSKPKANVGADVIMPLVMGFADDDKLDGRANEVFEAKKLDWDDVFIFSEKLDKNRVAFFFGDWVFAPVARAKQCELMNRKGIKYFDPKGFRLNRRHLLLVWKTVLRMITFMVLNPNILFEPLFITDVSGRIIYRFLEEMFFNNRVNYRVYVEWADQSPQSVMRTIVANSFGRITVGRHHSALGGPYGFPRIRYTYINKLCIWGDAFRRMFGRHWDIMDCHIIGLPRLDSGFKALLPDRLKELKNRYYERFGEVRPVVLITLPNPPKNVPYQIESRFDEFFRGLLHCCLELPPLRIVFRPRFAEHWRDYCEYELLRKIEATGKSIMDLTEFSVYEWIAISDLVLANSSSSVLIEASKMGKKCFTFDSRSLAEMVLQDYGKDLILKTADDVFNAVSGLFNDFKGFSCDWERLADDYCAFMDGKSTARFRDVIFQHISRSGNSIKFCKKGTKYELEK